MSAGVANSDLLDLTKTTLANLPDMDFEVALDYQDYPVVNHWFREDKIESDGGTSIKRNIILDTSGNARMVRPYQRIAINVTDVQQEITANWVQANTHWSLERHEILRNRGKAAYIKLLQSRRLDAMLDLADMIERKAWEVPTSSGDDLNPLGLPYWLSLRQASSSGEGFDAYTVRYAGGTTSTTKGGIDGSTTPNTKWRNWAATYTAINEDFVRKLRKAFYACNFKAPMFVEDLKTPKYSYRLYMGLDQLTEYASLATNRNDNLGPDVDKFHNMIAFNGVPVTYTPAIDSLTYDPIYGVNHKHFHPIVEKGNWLYEHEPMSDVEQPNTQTTHVDCSWQFFCNNVRQAGFALHTVTA